MPEPDLSVQLREFTDEQEQAVARRQGSLLLAAGAGSGKTSVLVERFVRAVREDAVAPARILAITFTERAAGELRERVRARFQALGEREAARDSEAAFVSTFHGFCARLLRTHPLVAGLDPDFEILDEGLAGRLRARGFRRALGEFLAAQESGAAQERGDAVDRGAAVDLLAAYGADRVRSIVLTAYAQLRSQGQRLPKLPTPSHSGEERALLACALLGELLEGFARHYSELKRDRGALDFDDLELEASVLLEQHEGVRATWAERFQLLMVDEFQDTNARQLAILAALERENLFTVGDELQSIYGFRHADVRLFSERRRRLSQSGGSLALTRNFRSRAPLLAAVDAVFAPRMRAGYTPLVADRKQAPGEAEEPLVELLLTHRRGWVRDDRPAEGLTAAPGWRQAEARLLARRVADLVGRGQARAGDVVVLLRALGDLLVYERALQEQGLRTLAAAGGFWGHQQVGDLVAYLRALANPRDELALHATLASPLVGLSSDGLALLARASHANRRGVWEVVQSGAGEIDAHLPARDRAALAGFRDRFAAERSAAPRRSIRELLRRAIAQSGYEQHVLSLRWGERRLANVHKLLRLALEFEAVEGRDLRGFLDHVSHTEAALSTPFGGRARSEPDAPVADAELDAVRLMSIHAAKGLEFGVVCVADLGRAPNVTVPDLLVDGTGAGRVGLRLVRLEDSEAVPSLDFEQLRKERQRAQDEEEDRIVYVAMTRARERLLLSGAVDFERWPQAKPGAPTIGWLAPALVADLTGLLASQRRPLTELTATFAAGERVRCWLNKPDAQSPGPADCARRHEVEDFSSAAAPASALGRLPPAEPLDKPVAEPPAEAVAKPPAEAVAKPPAESVAKPPAESVVDPAPDAGGVCAHVVLGDPTRTLSYTALAALERCGYRYYLERVLGLPENRSAPRAEPLDQSLDARTRGMIVHKLLEALDFARGVAPSPDEVDGGARDLGVAVGASERVEIASLLRAALDTDLARRLAAGRRVHREHPFAFSLGPGRPLLTGVLDLLLVDPGGACTIVDYKSDRVGEDEDMEALVGRDYGLQRLAYALAALHDGAEEVEVIHWFLERPREWVSARFSAAETERLQEQLLARVSARSFAPSETPHRALCLTCPGRAGLCSWGEAETLRELPAAQPVR